MEHEITFQQVKERVELPELLTHHGYTLKKGEHLDRGKYHVFEGDDKLVVFRGRGGEWMYFNSQDDRDKGSVIDWMKNRVSSGRLPGIRQEPGRSLWQSVNDHFRAYLGLPEAQRPRLDLGPALPAIEPGTRFQSLYTQDCAPLTDTAYLEGRGITKETLASPQFAGRILNQRHTVQREGLPAKTYVNTAFPAYHEGRVVGLELKGEGFKGQAPESDFARSLWLSKPAEGGRRPTALVVTESGVDALSYAQLHPQERALYASTAGILTQNKLFELKRVVAAEGLTTVRAAFDNDAQGHHFDTRLLAGLAGDSNPMKVVREHPYLLTVEITPVGGPAGVQAMAQQLKAYNARLTQHYQQLSGEPAGQAPPPTLREELIAVTRPQAGTYQFHLPMNREALAAFNQAAVQHLQFEQKVELRKAQGKDWNEDVKQARLHAVVRRELGGPAQPATAPAPAQPAPPADPARHAFLAAAEQLGRELRAEGETEAAAQLHDVSRHLSRQPQLRPADQLALTQVLSTVAGHETLQDSTAAARLRQGLPALEKLETTPAPGKKPAVAAQQPPVEPKAKPARTSRRRTPGS